MFGREQRETAQFGGLPYPARSPRIDPLATSLVLVFATAESLFTVTNRRF